MSFPRYESYKDSGVEWLGEVPSHWDVDRLKASVMTCRNGLWGEEPDGGDDDLICIRVADFDRVDFRVNLSSPTHRKFRPADREGRQLRRGDLLLEKSGGGEKQPVGAVVLFDDDILALCSNFVARLELTEGMEPRFWTYIHASMYAVRINERSIKQTSGIQNLDQSQYLEERAPFPPLPEQRAIAAFLDRETAKIDALVDEQRRLIDLLKEKRQAVISHAVTKGLDPTVPMKDSGVEWLGEVPSHWEVLPVWMLFWLGRGRVISHEYIGQNEGIYPVYSSQTENDGIMGLIKTYDFDGEYITWTTDGANAGTVFYRSGKFNCTNVCGTLQSKRNMNINYFHYALSRATKYFVRHDINPKLMNGVMAKIRLPVPPLQEQNDIVYFIESTTGQFENAIALQQEAITLLQERRAALISAAVTGKIDVRGLVPAEAEAA